jgi:leucyl aminopeptidase
MTTLNLSSQSPAGLELDAVVVGLTQGADGPVLAGGAESVDGALGGRLLETLVALGAGGKEGEVTRLATFGATAAPTLAAVGLGRPADGGRHSVEAIRRAAGSASRALAGTSKVASTLALVNGSPGVDEIRGAAEGALLGAYAFHSFKATSLEGAKKPVVDVTLVVPDPGEETTKATVRRAQAVARAVGLARDWVNTPPGDLPPAALADAAVEVCEPLGLEVEVLDEEALREGRYGGILGVGAGSSRPPRLVRIAYRRPGATRSIALVGKGVTFDSGGLSLKPAQAMESMKSDMGGAAAVIAAMTAIAALEPEVDVTGWAPLAENMPSGTAGRPSDVLRMFGGQRVEVLNTDAEGRLILGDAIARACQESPDYLLDAATLTGAQLVALGTRTAGVMGDDALRDRVVAAAERSGEAMWPMPLPPELRKGIDSEVADFTNTGPREGGMLTAGLFLKEFVADGVTWAHLDIAGPAFNQGEPHGYTPKGGTGAAVRTFVQVVEEIAAQG